MAVPRSIRRLGLAFAFHAAAPGKYSIKKPLAPLRGKGLGGMIVLAGLGRSGLKVLFQTRSFVWLPRESFLVFVSTSIPAAQTNYSTDYPIKKPQSVSRKGRVLGLVPKVRQE
jgi:hypothetical protein